MEQETKKTDVTKDQEFFNQILGKKEEKVEEKVEEKKEVVTEEKKEEKAAVQTDYNSIIAEKFGYNSLDDLLNSDAPERLKKYEEATSSLERYKQENEELISEFGTVNNPFANEYVAKLNHLLVKNPELSFEAATKILSNTEMSALDKIILAEKIKYPELSEAHIKRDLEKQFGVDDFSELQSSDIDDKTKLDIERLAIKAKKDLEKYGIVDYKADDKFIPEKVKERINQRIESQKVNEQEVERIWTPAVQHLEQNFKELDIPIMSEDNKVASYTKIVLTEAERKMYANYAMQVAKANNITKIDEQTQRFIEDAIVSSVIKNKLPFIIKVVADKAANMEFQRYVKERDGIKDDKADKSDKTKTSKDILDIIDRQIQRKSFRDVQD